MSLFQRFFRPTPAPSQPFSSGLAEPVYVIGDVHGCLEQLEAMLDKIWQAGGYDARIIIVGDMVDRGPDSAGVLRRLAALQRVAGTRLICLRGNHEDMMFDFLNTPEKSATRWFKSGGLDTLESFKVPLAVEDNQLPEIADRFRSRVGAELVNWLERLPLYWTEGNIGVVHAAADPTLPLNQQKDRTLMWGHEQFTKEPRTDGLWIVHGHTIVKEPTAQNGRISIDTGAYRGNALTAVRLYQDEIEFLHA